MKTHVLLINAAALAMIAGTLTVAKQAAAQAPAGYAGYFRQNVGVSPQVGTNQYLYNKYFYKNPSVSPYLGLSRPALTGTGYQAYVQPELERRETQQMASFKSNRYGAAQGGGGMAYGPRPSSYPSSIPMSSKVRSSQHGNPYYNQFYSRPR